MATVTAGYTWQSGEVVTPAKMNSAAVPTISNIVNADVSATAAIAGTKIAPNFGSQTATAQKFSPTGNITTGNGMYLPAADSVALSTAGSERARITAAGDFLIGTSTPLSVATGTTSGFCYAGNFPELRLSNASGPCLALQRSGTNGSCAQFFKDTTSVGAISVTATATSFNTSSDYRLKDNPQPLVGALSRLSQANPVTFTWKSNGEQGEGFIAHELQSVAPDAVTGEKDAVDAQGNPEYQGVDASKLVPLLVAAVKELSAKVEALEAK